MPQALLSIRNLKVAFKHENQWVEAVHGIDMDVFAGKTLGLVGESGSGKEFFPQIIHLFSYYKQFGVDLYRACV